jgi:hypothetical protein
LAILSKSHNRLGRAGVSWSQDWHKGVIAYKSGDYATALREWKPLAKQGDAIAQYKFNLQKDIISDE